MKKNIEELEDIASRTFCCPKDNTVNKKELKEEPKEDQTDITFEFENGSNTSVLVKRNDKTIGRVWSQNDSKTHNTPYPHNKSSYCLNSVQIWGFDRISEIWGCGPFTGKKDCVVHFIPEDNEYYIRKRKEYAEYVKNFFGSTIEEIKTGKEVMRFAKIKSNPRKDITLLQSFDAWVRHSI